MDVFMKKGKGFSHTTSRRKYGCFCSWSDCRPCLLCRKEVSSGYKRKCAGACWALILAAMLNVLILWSSHLYIKSDAFLLLIQVVNVVGFLLGFFVVVV